MRGKDLANFSSYQRSPIISLNSPHLQCFSNMTLGDHKMSTYWRLNKNRQFLMACVCLKTAKNRDLY